MTPGKSEMQILKIISTVSTVWRIFQSVFLAGLFFPFLSWLEHSLCCADSIPSRQPCCEHFGFVTLSPQQWLFSPLCFTVCCSADAGHLFSLQTSHPRASQTHPQLRLSRESWGMHILLPCVCTRANSLTLLGSLLQPVDPHPLNCSSHLDPVRACTQLWGDTCTIKGRRCLCYRYEVDRSQDKIKDAWVWFFSH